MISFNGSSLVCDKCLKIYKTSINSNELKQAKAEPQFFDSCKEKK